MTKDTIQRIDTMIEEELKETNQVMETAVFLIDLTADMIEVTDFLTQYAKEATA